MSPAPDQRDPLNTLLALPAASVIAPDLQRMLRETAAATADAGPRLRDPMPVLADTLASLATLGGDGEVMTAAILHVAEGWRARLEPVLQREHPAVAALLEGQRAASQVWVLHAEQAGTRNTEGLRRLLLAIVRDLRVVPILLARQLARLRAAAALLEGERRALAQLTRDIHAPLANRLGIWQLKWELEDLAFRHLEPAIYQRIARLLDEKRNDRQRYIEQVKAALGEAMEAQGLDFEVAGRPKHIYSIWKKMQKKNVPFGELYDLRAVRVLVGDVPACYAALGVVHALWAPVPSEFDDYIARPKRNDYRSLHTAVIGPDGKTLEVQIRTREMHAQAELGVAAHWRYKEGRSAAGDAALDRKIGWMRRLLDAQADGGSDDGAQLLGELDAELVEDRIYALTPRGEVIDLPQGATPLDFAYRVHTEVGHRCRGAKVDGRIYVLTPRGEVIDLPQGATPLDFAYHVHTEVGHRCRGAKVDGRIVPLDHVLRTGDRVEILTAKTGEPRRDWLVVANGFLASTRSREKVRNWFHRLDRTRNVQAGKELLDKELKRLGLGGADLAPVLSKFNASGIDDLHVSVALGDVGAHQVGRALHDMERAPAEAPAPRAPLRPPSKPRTPAGLTVQGVDNLVVQVARCCQPLPGEPVIGYLTRARGVSVHRPDCASFLRLSALQPQRVLAVEWGDAGGGHEIDVQLLALDRKWLLKDVTNLIAQENAHVTDLHTQAERGSGRVRLRLRLRVADFGQLSTLLGKLSGLSGVEEARRAG